jgi:hypothetical protein
MSDEQRESKIYRWMKIGGIGCAAAVLIFVGLLVAGIQVLRTSLTGFEQADSVLETVEEELGPIEGFRADPRGVIGSDRVEAFLTARESITPARDDMEHTLALLGGDEAAESPMPAVSVRRFVAGVGLLGDVAHFLHQRNQAMLDAEIGLGEYYYIYTLAYYSWLGKSPDDGPTFRLVGDRGYVLESLENLDEPEADVRAYRMKMAQESLNRLFTPVLREQLSAVDGRETEGDDESWREALAAEIEAMEADARRLPWQDGLPPVIESSLTPYRDRFEASYAAMCNALEIGLARR